MEKKIINNYELFEVLEDKTVDKDTLSEFYLFLDHLFYRYLIDRKDDLAETISSCSFCLSILGLLPDGVLYKDIVSCLHV